MFQNNTYQLTPTRFLLSMIGLSQPHLGVCKVFFGIIGYYKHFVRHYATLAAQLTNLLREDSFVWTSLASKAFHKPKTGLVETPFTARPVRPTPDNCRDNPRKDTHATQLLNHCKANKILDFHNPKPKVTYTKYITQGIQ